MNKDFVLSNKYKFITSANKNNNVSEDYINGVEKKYNIKFPKVLRDYYLNYNDCEHKECLFKIKFGNEILDFNLDFIIPLKYFNVHFEKEYEYVLKNDSISNEFFPLAVDIDGDNYYWKKTTGEVWYISHENVEHPILICESVEKYFEILNECCENNNYFVEFIDNENSLSKKVNNNSTLISVKDTKSSRVNNLLVVLSYFLFVIGTMVGVVILLSDKVFLGTLILIVAFAIFIYSLIKISKSKRNIGGKRNEK